MTDIVERLQYYTPYGPITDMQADAWMKEAADEIERLREALQPFACKCEGDWCENLLFNDDRAKCEHYIARTALEEKE